MKLTFYDFAKGIVSIILKPLYRIEVLGSENIPAEGGVLLCSNHINNFDPLVVGISSIRPVSFMAKEELFATPVLGNIVRKCNAFPVKRGMSDREALRSGLSVLKSGHVLGLFPEGTRSKTGQLGKGMAGAGFFALRSEAKVVPCAVVGPYKNFHRLRVVFGKPIEMDEMRKNKVSAEQVTENIMNEIRNLIENNK